MKIFAFLQKNCNIKKIILLFFLVKPKGLPRSRINSRSGFEILRLPGTFYKKVNFETEGMENNLILVQNKNSFEQPFIYKVLLQDVQQRYQWPMPKIMQ